MQCPFCGSDDYNYIDSDYDESVSDVSFVCLRKECGKIFYAVYSFMYFTDENGYEIDDSNEVDANEIDGD